HFVQFSSMGGRIGPPGRGPYSAAKWGVEGFSEVLSREVAPLGIKVTIVEPGGFRTDFAGSSTKLSEGNPDYDSTVGATARFQRDYNGKQPGDPKKAAQAIVRLTHDQKKREHGKNSACPLISSRSPHTRSDQSEPTFAGIRRMDVKPFRPSVA